MFPKKRLPNTVVSFGGRQRQPRLRRPPMPDMTAGKSDESNDDRILGGSGRVRSAEIAWRRGMARVARRQRIRRANARLMWGYEVVVVFYAFVFKKI